MKNKIAKFLRFMVRVWIYLVLASVVVGSLGILFLQGIWRFWEVMSPFNFSNVIVIVVLLIPAFILDKIADKLEKAEPEPKAIQ